MVIACLVVAAFILAACGPAATTTPPTTAPPTTPPTTTPPGLEKPQYGGTGTVATMYDILYFDDILNANVYCWSLRFTNDELLQGDWAKGPAGTGEAALATGRH